MSICDDVLALLADGRWHRRSELEAIAHSPEAWVRMLRLGGYAIEERAGSYRLARKPEASADPDRTRGAWTASPFSGV
jgi:hypothetical protein